MRRNPTDRGQHDAETARLAVCQSLEESIRADCILGEFRVIDSSVISITLSRNMNRATCATDTTPTATDRQPFGQSIE